MKPKSLHIATDIDADLLPAVTHAEEMLERILGRSAERVDVSWERGRLAEPTARSVRLTLTDTGVTKEYDFLEWEFDDDIQVRRRIRDVWSDILADRTRILQEQSVANDDDATGAD